MQIIHTRGEYLWLIPSYAFERYAHSMRRTACANMQYTKKARESAVMEVQVTQSSQSSRRKLTRSSQNEPSSSAAVVVSKILISGD